MVPAELRARVRQLARRLHVTEATVLERALDLLGREAFFTQVRRDVVRHPEGAAEGRERETWLGAVLSDCTEE